MKKFKMPYRLLVIMLTLAMIMTSISIGGTEVNAFAKQKESSYNDKHKNYTYTADGYKVKYVVNEKKARSYKGKIVITNTGKKTIENWILQFETTDNIKDLLGGKLIALNCNNKLNYSPYLDQSLLLKSID